MGLDLVDFSQLWQLENMNSAGFSILTHTTNECLLIVSETYLTQSGTGLEPVLGLLAVPDFLVIADSIHFEWLARDVDDRSEEDTLLIEILVVKSLTGLLLDDQIVEIDVTVHAA